MASLRIQRKRLLRRYGTVPDVHYFPGDMGHIRAYADYRRDQGRDAFQLDEITWYDLDLDRVFRRINHGLSTSGEQVLYHMLRAPALDESDWRERESLIRTMEEDAPLREKLSWILYRLGRPRRADLCTTFAPEERGIGPLAAYLALFAALLAAAAVTAVSFSRGVLWLIGLLVLNSNVHEFAKRKADRDLDTVNYTVAMIFALQRIRKLRAPALEAPMARAWESLDALRAVLRTGGVARASAGGSLADMLAEALSTFTLLDLITYEYLKNKLGRCHEDVFAVHEHLGRLDAAIAIASWRKSMGGWCVPEIDFARTGTGNVEIRRMVHPLLEGAVPNDFVTARPMLVTGSNASGKSTYCKTAALAVILAQCLCTCPAESYRAGPLRVYTSMALRDDLLGGESYYIVETRSLKRILDAAGEWPNVLCVVDEVLRGTNTVERIAASCEVLRLLAERGALCLAATHDAELCQLLSGPYRMAHFTEQIAGDEMRFDYRLREGAAVTRNAIELLRLMGFPPALVESAHARADDFLRTGRWTP